MTYGAKLMTEIIEGMEAVTVHTRDIHKARRFYREVLGLRELQFDDKASRAVFAITGTSVVLRMHVQGSDEGGRDPGTVSGTVFSPHDPVEARNEIRRRGGTITDEPDTINPPGMTVTVGVFADPDGNEFVLRSHPRPAG